MLRAYYQVDVIVYLKVRYEVVNSVGIFEIFLIVNAVCYIKYFATVIVKNMIVMAIKAYGISPKVGLDKKSEKKMQTLHKKSGKRKCIILASISPPFSLTLLRFLLSVFRFLTHPQVSKTRYVSVLGLNLTFCILSSFVSSLGKN